MRPSNRRHRVLLSLVRELLGLGFRSHRRATQRGTQSTKRGTSSTASAMASEGHGAVMSSFDVVVCSAFVSHYSPLSSWSCCLGRAEPCFEPMPRSAS